MQEEIIRIWQESKQRTVVFVTHDIDEAIYLADRIVIMSPNPGRVKSVLTNPMGRPRNRTSREFDQIREKVYQEFGLKVE